MGFFFYFLSIISPVSLNNCQSFLKNSLSLYFFKSSTFHGAQHNFSRLCGVGIPDAISSFYNEFLF